LPSWAGSGSRAANDSGWLTGFEQARQASQQARRRQIEARLMLGRAAARRVQCERPRVPMKTYLILALCSERERHTFADIAANHSTLVTPLCKPLFSHSNIE
jgi:hypothetical protein